MWTDQVDQANELAERERTAMAQVRKPVLPRTGTCHACGEDVSPEALFCDADCRDLWELQQRQAVIRGRKG